MRSVYEAIQNGCTYRSEIIEETKMREGRVKSAIWNLSYIGVIQRVDDDNGRSRYILPSIDVGSCFKGVNSIFNVR